MVPVRRQLSVRQEETAIGLTSRAPSISLRDGLGSKAGVPDSNVFRVDCRCVRGTRRLYLWPWHDMLRPHPDHSVQPAAAAR